MELTGEPRDLAGLYDTYAAMLYRYSVRRLGPAAAEEVVAETFLSAVAGWASFDPSRGEPRPWLFGILSHKIARHRRDEAAYLKALARVPGEAMAADQVDLADRVADAVSAGTNRAALLSALAELKPGDRDALLLLAWADMSYPEIAAALGIPSGTVRSRVHRARRLMRGRLPDLDLTEPITEPITEPVSDPGAVPHPERTTDRRTDGRTDRVTQQRSN
jgi:RNA polymerase sigma-70 factor (ECF subfamily)